MYQAVLLLLVLIALALCAGYSIIPAGTWDGQQHRDFTIFVLGQAAHILVILYFTRGHTMLAKLLLMLASMLATVG